MTLKMLKPAHLKTPRRNTHSRLSRPLFLVRFVVIGKLGHLHAHVLLDVLVGFLALILTENMSLRLMLEDAKMMLDCMASVLSLADGHVVELLPVLRANHRTAD